MNDKILITGAHGFLGRHCAKHFNQKGFDVYGIGRGQFNNEELKTVGLHHWFEKPITNDNLIALECDFKFIIHCAGGSSVAKSLDNPEADYNNTVAPTKEILEYIKLHSPTTRLIYTSSAAVYGECSSKINSVGDALTPSSPYGTNKQLAEELCLSYNDNDGINISIIRFFSIYGPELKKQLIWDACHKLLAADTTVEFWGTGQETRDWLFISDAVALIDAVSAAQNPPRILNGGTGNSLTIKEVLSTLATLLNFPPEAIHFKGVLKPGDPSHYLADTKEALSLNWKPKVHLEDGLNLYLKWFKEYNL